MYDWVGSKGNDLRGAVVAGDSLSWWLDCCKCLHYSDRLVKTSKSTFQSKVIQQTQLISLYWYHMSYSEPAILILKTIAAFKRRGGVTDSTIHWVLGKVEQPLERYNRFQNQDCWFRITHMIPIKRDQLSLMDDFALEGTFGGEGLHDPIGLGKVKKPFGRYNL